MIVICYVDDLLIFAKDTKEIDRLKIILNKTFTIKDVGNPTQLSQIELDWSFAHEQQLRQTTLKERLLMAHRMDESKPVSIPIIPVGLKWNDYTLLADKTTKKYCSIVGTLLYLAMKKRPEIVVAASKSESFVAEPKKAHFMAAKKTSCYLRGTAH